MISCHVTAIMGLFIVQQKQKQKKRNIKLRKINKKKRKMFKSRHTIIFIVFTWTLISLRNPKFIVITNKIESISIYKNSANIRE